MKPIYENSDNRLAKGADYNKKKIIQGGNDFEVMTVE